jgi:predicted phosphodiesterase
MADCRTGISVHNQITTLLRQRNPRFSIYGGDLCYGPDYYYWKTEFFTLEEQTTIFQIPFYAVVGNHEGWTTNTKAFEQNPVSSSGTQDYYSFDYGNVHFTVVNVMVNYNPGSPQYTFVSEDLSSTSKRWKIVVVHNPPYCAGGHGEDSVLITMAQNLFVPNNVDLVIAGHSHFYQHNLVNGIHYLVIGSAGAPLYTPGSNSYTIKSVQDYCWGVFDVESTSLVVRVYNNYDSLLDSLKLDKPLSGIEKKVSLVKETMLIQNFPNPFNSVTKIRFIIEKKSPVVLKIVNVLGKEITTLVNESLGEGTYEVDFDGSGLASGIYFCRLLVGDKQLSKKIMLLK